MGELRLNDISYTGGGATYIELTQQEYDALSDGAKNNGTLYFITDGVGSAGNVSKIDTLWEGSETPSGLSVYEATLNNPVTDYDAIVIEAEGTNTTVRSTGFFLSKDLVIDTGYKADNLIYIIPKAADTIWLCAISAEIEATYKRIRGVKFGYFLYTDRLAPMIYSETEREIGAWIDDKPLYQKTIVASYPSGVSSGEHVVESIADIEVVNAYGHYIETSSGYDYTIPYAQSNGSSLYYYQGDMYFAIGNNVGFDSGTLYLTILYTKDNDTAGSGSYGSLGIPMVHYDDSEKVIGTWFGETVYEKTFSGTISGTNTAITTNLNIGRLVDIEASGEKTSGGSTIRFGMDYRDGSDWLNVHCSGNNIRIMCSSWFSGADIKVTLRYTKSTT